MELLDIFYLWSVPYMIVDGSLLNLYRWVIVIVDLLSRNLDIYLTVDILPQKWQCWEIRLGLQCRAQLVATAKWRKIGYRAFAAWF